MTAVIRRRRRWARLALEEQASSAATAAGRVRGRPTGPGMRTLFKTAMSRGRSAVCPGVSTKAGGSPATSSAAWTLLLGPPRDRPSPTASARALRRRHMTARSWPDDASAPPAPDLTCGAPPAAPAAAPEAEPPFFLGQRLLQRIQGLPGDRRPGRLLMRPHDRGVHTDQFQPDLPARYGLGDQRVHQRPEHPGSGPAAEPEVERGPRPVPFRDITPAGPGAEPPQDPVELITHPPGQRPGSRHRQMRLDQRPLGIGHIKARHVRVLPATASPPPGLTWIRTPNNS